MDDLDMNDPEIRKNILVAFLGVTFLAVVCTVIFTTMGWKWGVASIFVAFLFGLWMGRRSELSEDGAVIFSHCLAFLLVWVGTIAGCLFVDGGAAALVGWSTVWALLLGLLISFFVGPAFAFAFMLWASKLSFPIWRDDTAKAAAVLIWLGVVVFVTFLIARWAYSVWLIPIP